MYCARNFNKIFTQCENRPRHPIYSGVYKPKQRVPRHCRSRCERCEDCEVRIPDAWRDGQLTQNSQPKSVHSYKMECLNKTAGAILIFNLHETHCELIVDYRGRIARLYRRAVADSLAGRTALPFFHRARQLRRVA